MSVLVVCLGDLCVVYCGILCVGSELFGVKGVWCFVFLRGSGVCGHCGVSV